MEMQLREQVQFMQEISRSYDSLQSLFIGMVSKLEAEKDLLNQYNIKKLSLNDTNTELEIHVIGQFISAQYSMVPNKTFNSELGKIEFYKIANSAKISIASIYFDKHTLYNDIKCESNICDIDNRYFHEHFLLSFMSMLLRHLGFIK